MGAQEGALSRAAKNNSVHFWRCFSPSVFWLVLPGGSRGSCCSVTAGITVLVSKAALSSRFLLFCLCNSLWCGPGPLTVLTLGPHSWNRSLQLSEEATVSQFLTQNTTQHSKSHKQHTRLPQPRPFQGLLPGWATRGAEATAHDLLSCPPNNPSLQGPAFPLSLRAWPLGNLPLVPAQEMHLNESFGI